jgi:hypothetical protein
MADSPYAEVTEDGITVGSNYDTEEQIRASLTVPSGDEPAEPEPPTTTTETADEPAPEAAKPANDEPEPAKEADETPKPDTLYFRDDTGKFRAATGKEIKHALQKRVNTLTEKLRPAERENQALKAELSAIRRQSEAPAAPKAKPELSQFQGDADPYAAFTEALAEWKADEKVSSVTAAQQTAAEQAQSARALADFQARQAAFADEHPDYGDVVGQSDLTVSPLMQMLMRHDGRGPEMMYYLGNHPDECLDLALATMSAPLTEASLDALSRRLTLRMDAAVSTGTPASPAVPSRSVTRPIRPVRTSRTADGDRPPGESASSAEFNAYWNQWEREEARRR